MTDNPKMSMSCEIRTLGHLTPEWGEWFCGLRIENQPDGAAILSGILVDQSAMIGVLYQVNRLGLQIIALHCALVDATPEERGGV